MIHQHPRGWWFFDERPHGGGWCGPFPSAEEAEKTARMLISDNQKTIPLIEMQLWEQKEVKK
jgi:hypothetical protein